MHKGRNYYEILGLTPTATTAEIKRKYRQLARKYHPDVVQDKSLGQRAFIQITEAYKTLIDPIKRREYDESLNKQRPRTSSTYESASSGTRSSQTSYGAREQQSASTPPKSRLIKEAEYAFIRGRWNVAADFCHQAIREGVSVARAHSILGDIYRIKGQTDRAISEYMAASRLDPSNEDVASKLRSLLNRGRPQPQKKKRKIISPEVREENKRITVKLVGWVIVAFVALIFFGNPGEPSRTIAAIFPFLENWSWNLVFAILIDSILIGILMSVSGDLGHPDNELIFGSEDGGSMIGFPAGLFLLVFSVFFFWVAAGIYTLIAYLQDTLSRSVIRVFKATIGIVLFAALFYPHGSKEILLFGGNLAFIGLAIGWYTGAMTRPLGGWE